MQAPKIGMLTPSSNTRLEPLTCQILQNVACSVHFSRFPVRQISLAPEDLAQFDMEPMIGAARLLADAGVDVIVWNGTSGGWLGRQADEQLAAAITRETGIVCTTTLLAQFEAFRQFGIRRVGLAVPYQADVTEAIAHTFTAAGYPVTASQHLGICVNTAFADVPYDTIEGLMREVADGADAISVFCTNLAGAPLVEKVERDTGVMVFDSVAVSAWGAFWALGVPLNVSGWGRLLEGGPPLA